MFDEFDWFLKPNAKKDNGDGDNKNDDDDKYYCPPPKGHSKKQLTTVKETYKNMKLKPFKYEPSMNHVKLQ